LLQDDRRHPMDEGGRLFHRYGTGAVSGRAGSERLE
jgi:hypothetical protein